MDGEIRLRSSHANICISIQVLIWSAPSIVFEATRVPGIGACEIRVHEKSGAYRAIYVARLENAVCVLHAFQKKSRKTSQKDIELARVRYKMVGKTS
jgi:phage-related protein